MNINSMYTYFSWGRSELTDRNVKLYPQFFFRTNYYSIEIPHGVTAISLTYHPHHAKLQDLHLFTLNELAI